MRKVHLCSFNCFGSGFYHDLSIGLVSFHNVGLKVGSVTWTDVYAIWMCAQSLDWDVLQKPVCFSLICRVQLLY